MIPDRLHGAAKPATGKIPAEQKYDGANRERKQVDPPVVRERQTKRRLGLVRGKPLDPAGEVLKRSLLN